MHCKFLQYNIFNYNFYIYVYVKFLTLRWRYFWRKSNQNVGVATPPHPNAAQCVETLVCYKSVKITNLSHCVPSHCNFSSIYASISPPASLHCVWLTLAICLLSAATAIVIRGNSFPEPLSSSLRIIFPHRIGQQNLHQFAVAFDRADFCRDMAIVRISPGHRHFTGFQPQL